MENKNIYDDLFNIYEHSQKFDYNSLQSQFENELENLFSDDLNTYNDMIYKLHNLLDENNKKYYIAGFKSALDLLR